MSMTPARLPLLSIVCAVLSGCAAVVLHPIQDTDIVTMPAGQAYTPSKDGYFLSDLYVKEVLNAKVEQRTR